MKKFGLLKTMTLTFLSSLVVTLYVAKLESIILSVEMLSYFIFASVIVISGLVLYTKENIKDWLSLISKKNKDFSDVPSIIYNFCRKYYIESESATIDFVKNEVKDKNIANFFIRYLDKNTTEEINDYLEAEELKNRQVEHNARKIVYSNNLLITLGTLASYIYDSNIKGILLLGGCLSVYNMFIARNIESNIDNSNKLLKLFKNINEDILMFKNPKSIEYKCKSLLGFDDVYLTVDNFEPQINIENNIVEEENKSKDNIQKTNVNISGRKSSLITIGKNKNKVTNNNSKTNKL